MPYTRCVKVVGLYLVRNEVDIIETNLRHHLTPVIDEAIVIDNGSSDGTFELLVELAEQLPIQLASEAGHMYQSDRVTRMARFATVQGADWVLPIDADEFWVARGLPSGTSWRRRRSTPGRCSWTWSTSSSGATSSRRNPVSSPP